jgi:hypothetical protein
LFNGFRSSGLEGKFSDTFNDIVDTCERMSRERVGQTVGREGKTRRQEKFGRSGGAWGEMKTSINTLIDDLLCKPQLTCGGPTRSLGLAGVPQA